ncbi:MAG: hypothetical protein IRZ15_00805 [Bryobacteraceae bacterium]|nr:hypothetical protein [Bryobacteraceae bacterium]
MGFLDELENNLKALESRDERDPEKQRREQDAREAARLEALKRIPHIDALKKGPFTEQLLTSCRKIGHGMRTLVQFTWLDSTLRLDAKEKRLELRPTADGVQAVYFVNGVEQRNEMLDLNSDAEAFARRWLEGTAQ